MSLGRMTSRQSEFTVSLSSLVIDVSVPNQVLGAVYLLLLSKTVISLFDLGLLCSCKVNTMISLLDLGFLCCYSVNTMISLSTLKCASDVSIVVVFFVNCY